jgi:hypothetical protein
MMLFKSDLEKIRAKIATKHQEIAAAEQRRRAQALEAALSDDPAAGQALLAEMMALTAELQLLTEAEGEAQRVEAEKAAAAQTAEEQRLEEARARARLAQYNAARKHMERFQRAAGQAESAIAALATAFAVMRDAEGKFDTVTGGHHA